MTGAVDALEYRRVVGRFATGVTVVATERDGEAHAMTANAFTSVSLDPPLVLVSIDHRAKMHQLLPDTRRFGISVLGCEQERVAWHFAGRPLAAPGELFVGGEEVPLVAGAIAHVGCALWACHEAGDHTLYLGLVEHAESRPGEPLLFHRGEFGRVSPYPEAGPTWGW